MAQVIADAELYDLDFYAWTRAQAAKLRRLHEQSANLDLDLPHLAEEVEDLGKSEREAVRSQLERIIEHCLKLEYSPAPEPRLGWYDSIDDARRQLTKKLTPTLHADLERELPGLYRATVRWTRRALRRHGETEVADLLPESCLYEISGLLDESWYPSSRHGL